MNGRMETGWQDRTGHPSECSRPLNRLALVGVIGGAALVAYAYLVGGGTLAGLEPWERVMALAPFFGSWLVALAVWLWRGLGYWPRASALMLSAYVAAGVLFVRQGLGGSGRLWLAILPAFVFAFMGIRLGQFATLLSVLIYAALTGLVSQGWSPPHALDPAPFGRWISEAGAFLFLTVALIPVFRSLHEGWARTLSEADVAQKQLEAAREKLTMLSKKLRRRSSQLETAATVARAGASTLELDAFLDEVLLAVLRGFDTIGIDYVGCFLLEGSGDAVVLRAGAGRRGEPALERGDRLGLDRQSPVAAAVADGDVQIANRSIEGAEQVRSEIALPLRSANQVLGAITLLSAQEVEALASREEEIDQLQNLADQVAVTIRNAQFFSEVQATRAELEALRRRSSTAAWSRFPAKRSDFQVDYVAPGIEASDDGFLHEARQLARKANRPVARDNSSADSSGASSGTEGALVVPLRLRGEPIGTIALHETRRKPTWTAEDVALTETVAQEVAQTVENLLLMAESRRRLARERLIGDVVAQMRESLDVESVLKTGAVGIREAMGLPGVTVRMTDRAVKEPAESS